MTGPDFYDAGAIRHLAINLFNGWGYDFYRTENQLRADDLTVRAQVCNLLAAARASVESAEQSYRREFLPPPSRAKPRPDPDAVQSAQALEGLGRALGAIEGQIRALPAPENDRMSQRFRREAPTLSRLVEADHAMVGHAEYLRALLASADARWILDNTAALRAQVAAIEAAVQSRRDILTF
jgi:hypothetical protein